ncbi:membrane protein insertase YidC [Micromonospora sp. NPDC049559]|uniref:YidC/Oxa1 family membrane protein insertase n=1 Tax=Micromonospora sp. NPDC049559 TaxID=3155923 RepID=UPI0034200A16
MLAFAPLDGAVGVAATVVTALADAVAPLAGSAATACAIVLFTIAVRLLISPLTWAQIRGQRRQAALAPRIADLRRRYAREPEKLRNELMALHREAGTSPLAGCLPGLLQAPFFVVMYHLFATSAGAAVGGGLLAERLFGVPLGQHLGDGLGGAAGPVFGVLLALLAGTAWLSSRRIRRSAAANAANANAAATATAANAATANAANAATANAAKVGGAASAAGAAAGRNARNAAAGTNPTGAAPELPGAGLLVKIMPLLPYTTLLAAAVVPLAAVLYLVTTTAWTALEQGVLRREKASTAVDMLGAAS